MQDTIFIQLVSYRDPELRSTIIDCINKSTYQDRLRFGIVWQHSAEDSWDQLEDFKNDPRFSIIDVIFTESKGLAWARSMAQRLWKNETYTMCIEAHHRFTQGWDEQCIYMMKQTGSTKPILTTIGSNYTPGRYADESGPFQLVANEFTAYGNIIFSSQPVTNHYESPIPTRFISNQFYFTIGNHCIECPYDPNLFFIGEELNLSIRSFTLGYDMYQIHKVILWHLDKRECCTNQWETIHEMICQKAETTEMWYQLEYESKRRLQQLLKEEEHQIDLKPFTLGTVRSHADYENYAGINFSTKKLHPRTSKGYPPPINEDYSLWEKDPIQYDFTITLGQEPNEYNGFLIEIMDVKKNVLHQYHFTRYQAQIYVSFVSTTIPYKWVYVVGNKGKWVTRAEYLIPEQYHSIKEASDSFSSKSILHYPSKKLPLSTKHVTFSDNPKIQFIPTIRMMVEQETEQESLPVIKQVLTVPTSSPINYVPSDAVMKNIESYRSLLEIPTRHNNRSHWSNEMKIIPYHRNIVKELSSNYLQIQSKNPFNL